MPSTFEDRPAGPFIIYGNGRSYEFKNVVGKGARSVVMAAYCHEDHKTYAIKVVGKAIERCVVRVRKEIAVLRRLKHPNIIRLIDTFENDTTIFLVFEMMEKTLLSVCCREGKLSLAKARFFLEPLARAIHYMHSNNVVHLDVKLENIMMDANNQPVLIDFGFAEEVPPGQLLQRGKGSYNYMSPEIVRNEPYDPRKADMWSLGILLYAMVTARFPFDDRATADPRVIMELIKNAELKIPLHVPIPAANLLTKMLQRDPAKRIEFDALLRHPFFTIAPAG